MSKRLGKERAPRDTRHRLPRGVAGTPNGPHTTKGECHCGGCSSGRNMSEQNPLKAARNK